MAQTLKIVSPETIPARDAQAYDDKTLAIADSVLKEIEAGGQEVLLKYAREFDGFEGESVFLSKAELKQAEDSLDSETHALLTRVAGRVRDFATAQCQALKPVKHAVPGGFAGHDIVPVGVAGCYIPGGRYPLVSTALMTIIPARVAGVDKVWAASPSNDPAILAAASIAGADGFLTLGGIQAVGAMAYGTNDTGACDVIVGPGNRWVTAAKKLVSGQVAIDMLAGPSELLVLADAHADASIIAADLLAQAEHDPDAQALLVTTDKALIERVNAALVEQLSDLPSAEIAEQALDNSYAVLCDTMDQAVAVTNRLAPEHLEVMTENHKELREKLPVCGGLFSGVNAAEVIGDYGVGPNHTLPTGGTARSRAGLSVYNFLKTRTWIDIDDAAAAQGVYADSVALGRMEGLEGHARSAEKRLK